MVAWDNILPADSIVCFLTLDAHDGLSSMCVCNPYGWSKNKKKSVLCSLVDDL